MLSIIRLAAIKYVDEIAFAFGRYDLPYATRCTANEVAAAIETGLPARLRVKLTVAFFTFGDVVDMFRNYGDSTQLLHSLHIVCPFPTPADQMALHQHAFASADSQTTWNDRRLLDNMQITIFHKVDGVDTSYQIDKLERDSDLPRSLAWLCSPFVRNSDDCNLTYDYQYRREYGNLCDTANSSTAFEEAMEVIFKRRGALRRPGWARVVRPSPGNNSGQKTTRSEDGERDRKAL